MKYALIALLLTGFAFGQDTAPATPNESNSPAASPPAQAIPTDQANSQKAKQIIDQAIQALGGQAYLNIIDMKLEGRAYSFHHGELCSGVFGSSPTKIAWSSRKSATSFRYTVATKGTKLRIRGFETWN